MLIRIDFLHTNCTIIQIKRGTPLDDFGTSPSTHCVHPHVDTAGVLSNGNALQGVNGILWVYHLHRWLCSVIEAHKTVNLGSNKRQVVIWRVINPVSYLESHAWQNKECDIVNVIKLPLCWHFIYSESAVLWGSQLSRGCRSCSRFMECYWGTQQGRDLPPWDDIIVYECTKSRFRGRTAASLIMTQEILESNPYNLQS